MFSYSTGEHDSQEEKKMNESTWLLMEFVLIRYPKFSFYEQTNNTFFPHICGTFRCVWVGIGACTWSASSQFMFRAVGQKVIECSSRGKQVTGFGENYKRFHSSIASWIDALRYYIVRKIPIKSVINVYIGNEIEMCEMHFGFYSLDTLKHI